MILIQSHGDLRITERPAAAVSPGLTVGWTHCQEEFRLSFCSDWLFFFPLMGCLGVAGEAASDCSADFKSASTLQREDVVLAERNVLVQILPIHSNLQ